MGGRVVTRDILDDALGTLWITAVGPKNVDNRSDYSYIAFVSI